LHEFASEGFRTLLVGKRSIPKEEYEEWSKKYEVITNILFKRNNIF